jgi:hypothetical protein
LGTTNLLVTKLLFRARQRGSQGDWDSLPGIDLSSVCRIGKSVEFGLPELIFEGRYLKQHVELTVEVKNADHKALSDPYLCSVSFLDNGVPLKVEDGISASINSSGLEFTQDRTK